MQTKFLKLLIFVILSISLLNSCTFVQDSGDKELEQLQEQINQMATQNASLQDQLSESNNEDIDAPSPPEDDAQNKIALSTPTPETLPVDPVPAGVPVVYGGWSMTVSKEIRLDDGVWSIEIFVRNLGETDRIFRYTNAGITAKDDLGNIYDYFNERYGSNTCEKFHHTVKNLNVRAESSVNIDGRYSCWFEYSIHNWQGPIPLEASQIIIMFEDFGPFDGVEVVIDL